MNLIRVSLHSMDRVPCSISVRGLGLGVGVRGLGLGLVLYI